MEAVGSRLQYLSTIINYMVECLAVGEESLLMDCWHWLNLDDSAIAI